MASPPASPNLGNQKGVVCSKLNTGEGPCLRLSKGERGPLFLLVQDNTEQGTVDLQATIVVKEAELFEFVQEEVHSGAGSPNHRRQSFLTYLWDDGCGLVFFSETGQYKKRSGQTFL